MTPPVMILPAIFAFLLMTGGAHAATASEYSSQGDEFVRAKEYKRAAGEYEKALRSDPDNAGLNLKAGIAHARAGDLDTAIRYTGAAAKKEPSYAAYNNLGLIYANRGDYEKSLEAQRKAIEINPSSYQAWFQVGLLHMTKSKYSEAADAYRKAIELNPLFGKAYLGLASALYWTGNKDGATEQVKKLQEKKFRQEAAELEAWIKRKEEASVPSPTSEQTSTKTK